MIKIIDGKLHYYDCNGDEIHERDLIRWPSGKVERVYLTEDGELGTDATNPLWVEDGRAVPCEYGIYPFSDADTQEIELTGESCYTAVQCVKPIYKVPVYWEMYGYLEVEANSPQEALKEAERIADDCDLPDSAEYVDESFKIDRKVEPFRADGLSDGAPA